MLLSRGGFVKVAAGAIVLSSGLNVHEAVAALPSSVTPDQLDDGGSDATTSDAIHKKGQVIHSVREKGPVTTPYLVAGYKNIGGSTMSGPPWKGQTQVLIDQEGNWEFSGVFPGDGLMGAWNIATGIALTAEELGTAFAWTAQGHIDQYRDPGPGMIVGPWSFKSIGHSQLIVNLWKYAVKGHKFAGSSVWQLIPAPHTTIPGFDPTGASLLADVKSTLASKIGTIGAFY